MRIKQPGQITEASEASGQDTFGNNANTAAYYGAEAAGSREFLAFTVGTEEYGLAITEVRELRQYTKPTTLADMPRYFKGVINLRGEIVPVLDLRIQLGISEPEYNLFTVVIIAKIGAQITGLVVDSVSDVLQLSSAQIKPTPPIHAASSTEFLHGIGTCDGRMLMLIDLQKLVLNEELTRLESMQELAA